VDIQNTWPSSRVIKVKEKQECNSTVNQLPTDVIPREDPTLKKFKLGGCLIQRILLPKNLYGILSIKKRLNVSANHATIHTVINTRLFVFKMQGILCHYLLQKNGFRVPQKWGCIAKKTKETETGSISLFCLALKCHMYSN
jgi:hypothetical protein